MRSLRLGDLVAGVSVGLVVIPQSLAYAQVAGVPPERGLYSAGVPSIAAAPFASSRLLQTGPVGVTALLTFGALSSHATARTEKFAALASVLALLVGVIRLAIGWLRLGELAYLLSPPMLLGFMPAAAILIVASQVPSIAGLASGHDSLRGLGWTIRHVSNWSGESIAFAVATGALVVGGRRISRLFPSILLAVALGIAISEATGYSRPVVGAVSSSFPAVSLHVTLDAVRVLAIPAIVIAILGFAEPASIARTFAAQDRERWKPNREFISQGVANIASSLVGGFPVGGSFSRTSLNRLAGAQTRWSGAISGAVAVAFLPFASILHPLPRAILGAIVVTSVAPLLRLGPLLGFWRVSRPQATIATATFLATLGLAPHVEYAVLLGVGLSIANHLAREYRVDLEAVLHGDRLVLRVRGVLWFGSAQALEDQALDLIAAHPQARQIEIDLRGVGRVDVAGALALRALVSDSQAAGLDVLVAGVPPRARHFVEELLPSHCFDDWSVRTRRAGDLP